MSVFRPDQDHDDEGATSMIRRLAVLGALLFAVAAPAAAQTEPARLAVTATSDHCADGLPVVDYTVTNLWSAGASVQTWWLADASVWDTAATHSLGAAPDRVAGSFRLPYNFYATVTVFATTYWPDGQVTTNASWAIPVADCAAPAPPTTTPTEPTPTTTPAEPTTTDDGKDKDKGNGHATTTVEAG
jgi:hypothetical protein